MAESPEHTGAQRMLMCHRDLRLKGFAGAALAWIVVFFVSLSATAGELYLTQPNGDRFQAQQIGDGAVGV